MSLSPHDGMSAITRRDTEMTFRPSGALAPAPALLPSEPCGLFLPCKLLCGASLGT